MTLQTQVKCCDLNNLAFVKGYVMGVIDNFFASNMM